MSGFNNDPWRFVTMESFDCVQLQAVIKFKSDSIKGKGSQRVLLLCAVLSYEKSNKNSSEHQL